MRRGSMAKKQSLTMRSLHYYWLATRNHLGLFVALVASTIGFCGFLTSVSYTHLTLPTIYSV